MKTWKWVSKILAVGIAGALLGGCAAMPYGSPYASQPPAVTPGASGGFLNVGPRDRTYVMTVENNTPFVVNFHRANSVLQAKGYDRVLRENVANFAIDVALFTESRDSLAARGEHALVGGLLGAAGGALIGAAAGNAATGAIAGTAGGGLIGAVVPASHSIVKIAIQIHSFRTGASSQSSVCVNMANVPSYEVPRVIDNQVARMLGQLPDR